MIISLLALLLSLPLPETHSFATNISWDSSGVKDERPGTWGLADVNEVRIPFIAVPPGHRVRLLHARGDQIAFAHGAIPVGKFAGVLFGITSSAPWQSSYVTPGLGSSGTALYVQGVVGSQPSRVSFDSDLTNSGLLESDHAMILKQALFESELGVSVHMECSLVIDFRYEKW